MDVAVYLPFYLGCTLAVVSPWIAKALPPRTGVWCLTAAAVTSALSWLASLIMVAFTGLGKSTFVAREGHWSANRWRAVDPVNGWTAAVAGMVVIVSLAMLTRAAIREVIARRAVRQVAAGFPGGDPVVFVDDDVPHAYAIGGRTPRIVVSRGLLRSLSVPERRAVLSHEFAHLRHRHHVHLMALRLAAAVNPLLYRFTSPGSLLVERWADEVTATDLGDRPLVARALLRAALAGAKSADVPHGALAHTHSAVGERVTALMKAPPQTRWPVAVCASVLLVATIVAPIAAVENLDALFDLASRPATGPAASSLHLDYDAR